MSARLPEPAAERPPRGRLFVLAGAAILLGTAWLYCRGGDQSLFTLVSVLSAAAFALPRAFRGNVRWVVWTWLAISVACLAANVERLAPPEQQAEGGREIERLVTAALAVGVTALFFRPSGFSVTLVACGALPMAMFVLGGGARTGVQSGGVEGTVVWSLVALLCALDQVQRLTRTRAASPRPPNLVGEIAVRAAALGVVCGLAFALRAPVEQLAVALQKRVFGWVADADRDSSGRRKQVLSVGRSAPAGFAGRMRVVLLVRTKAMPGYLRESVYTAYRAGHWFAPRSTAALQSAARVSGGAMRTEFPLAPSVPGEAVRYWHVEVLAPRELDAVCLPGSAVSLLCDGSQFTVDSNGVVRAEGEAPERYGLEVAQRGLTASGYSLPDGARDPVYLSLPRALAPLVTNWVSSCDGLAAARTAGEAVLRVEQHFASNFSYRLSVQYEFAPDPLADFMRRREGACAQFASAAALMLRACGLPSRVVGGYVCCTWNPWLGGWASRERDSHAWVEVWDAEARRWLVADPTPPDGRPAAMAAPGRARLALDWLFASWRRALFALKNANLLFLIASAGAQAFDFLWQLAWSPAGAVAALGLGAILWLRRRARLRRGLPTDRLRAELAVTMGALATRSAPGRLRRRPAEAWGAWLARVKPVLPAEAFAELSALAEEYQELRYGASLDAAAARGWLRRAAASPRAARRRGGR